MSLEIKKIYIDSRYKTSDSKSESEFTVDLPRSFNIPDDTVAYIDDIVLPISWRIVNENNHNFHYSILYEGITHHYKITLPLGNYNGTTFAAALESAMNVEPESDKVFISVTYEYLNNNITIKLNDRRTNPPAKSMQLGLFTDKSLASGAQGEYLTEAKTINNIINLDADQFLFNNESFVSYLDLHVVRNLYLLSSALASYDTVSNFGNDTIIKKIPVRGNVNDIIFDNASEGFDYLNVSRRTLRHIDFKLVDTNNKVVNLNGTHWSLSVVFQRMKT